MNQYRLTLNIAKSCHFLMKNQDCETFCHFHNFFAKNLP